MWSSSFKQIVVIGERLCKLMMSSWDGLMIMSMDTKGIVVVYNLRHEFNPY